MRFVVIVALALASVAPARAGGQAIDGSYRCATESVAGLTKRDGGAPAAQDAKGAGFAIAIDAQPIGNDRADYTVRIIPAVGAEQILVARGVKTAKFLLGEPLMFRAQPLYFHLWKDGLFITLDGDRHTASLRQGWCKKI